MSGTTGFTDNEITLLKNDVEKYYTSLLIAPNFCIGAVLMMKFSQAAAKHFSGCEIIELHHTQKADFPSGSEIDSGENRERIENPSLSN